MSHPKQTPDRSAVMNACRKYFEELELSRGLTFIAGETYVPVSTKVLDCGDLEALIEASLDLWLTAGRFANEFEKEFPKVFNRSTSALLVNSGSSANLCAISSLGSPVMEQVRLKPLKAGDEVITAAAGFPTTVNPIIQNGWTPVFIDVDADTLNARPEKILEAITPKTRAVVLAHALGNPFRVDQIVDECRQRGIFIVEDCCDALGAKIGDLPVGSFGDYATASFYPAHHITMGEGGAVVSRSGGLRRVAESIRDWGRDCWCEPGKDNTCNKRFCWKLGDLPFGYDHKYTYSALGYNLKATDMQASIGLSQLKKLERFMSQRRSNWKKLYDGCQSSPVLTESFTPVTATAGTSPSWFGFPLYCAEKIDREKVVSLLEERKIGSRLVFGGNLTKQPAYKNVHYRIHDELKNTDQIMAKAFWLGVHPALDDQRINYILEQLESIAHVAKK